MSELPALPDPAKGHYVLLTLLDQDFKFFLKHLDHQDILALARTCKVWMNRLETEYRHAFQFERAIKYGISPWAFFAEYRNMETVEYGMSEEHFRRPTLALKGRLDRLMRLDATIEAEAIECRPLKFPYDDKLILDPERHAHSRTQVRWFDFIQTLLPNTYQLLKAFHFYGYTLAFSSALSAFYLHTICGEHIQHTRRIGWDDQPSDWPIASQYDEVFISQRGDVILYYRLCHLFLVLPSNGQDAMLKKIYGVVHPVFSPAGSTSSVILSSDVQVPRRPYRKRLWHYVLGTGVGYRLGDFSHPLYNETGIGSIIYQSNDETWDVLRIWSWQNNAEENTLELCGWELKLKTTESVWDICARISECGKFAMIANVPKIEDYEESLPDWTSMLARGHLMVRLEDGAARWQEPSVPFIFSLSRDLRRAIVSSEGEDYLITLQWPQSVYWRYDQIRVLSVTPIEDTARLMALDDRVNLPLY